MPSTKHFENKGHEAGVSNPLANMNPGKLRRASVGTRVFALALNEKQYNDVTWCCGLLFFEKDIGNDTISDLVKEKLLQIPRFKSFYNLKEKSFEELAEDDVDLDYHVKFVDHTVLDLETIQDDYIGKIYKHFDFDPNAPLWQFTYFPKISDGRALLICNIAHTIGDGAGLIEVIHQLFDVEKTEGTVLTRPAKRKKPTNMFGPLNRVRIFMSGLGAAATSAIVKFDTKTSLMRKDPLISGDMKTAFTENIPLEKIKDIKNKFPGATVNDVLISLLTLTLREYFAEDDISLLSKKCLIRAGIPINVRKNNQSGMKDGSPYNRSALVTFPFHLKFKDSIDLVWKVKRTVDKMKLNPESMMQKHVIGGLFKIFSQKRMLQLLQEKGSETTAMLSSVPGPAKAAHLKGHKVQDFKFLLNGPVGVYLGLLTYNGQVSCGICTDDGTSGDPKDLAKHWKPQFDKFYQEVMSIEGQIKKPKIFLDRI